MSKNKNEENNNELNTFLQGYGNNRHKLAVIAGIVTTLGHALGTMVAIMALEEEEAQIQRENGNRENGGNNVSMDKYKELEKQVRYLTNEMNKMKYPKK